MAQELEKAKIQSIVPRGQAFDVLLNPKEYRLSKSNQFAEVAIPGLSAPLLQFARGNAQTLTLQLLCDTYDPQYSNGAVEKDKDVRFYTQNITNLMKIDQELHAPPVCQFSWANLTFIGVMQQADVRFTLFLPSGIPVRATVDVTFKQFYDGKAETGMLQSANYEKQYIVRPGDTLPGIAAEKYQDPTNWRPIAEMNNIYNPLDLKPGQLLKIPAIE